MTYQLTNLPVLSRRSKPGVVGVASTREMRIIEETEERREVIFSKFLVEFKITWRVALITYLGGVARGAWR